MFVVLCFIAQFTIVQSVFGIGLLVFGTLTLLLPGHPFAEVPAIPLPASLTFNWTTG